MPRFVLVVFVFLALLSASSFAPGLAPFLAPSAQAQIYSRSDPLSAQEAIELSTARPGAPVGPVWVKMDVCGTGVVGGRVFLNSLEDYRDRASLNAFIPPWHREPIGARVGGAPEEVLLGYRVRVRGRVYQAQIDLLDTLGRPNGEFYFQTHLHILGPEDLEIVMVDGEPAQAVCGPLIS